MKHLQLLQPFRATYQNIGNCYNRKCTPKGTSDQRSEIGRSSCRGLLKVSARFSGRERANG